MRGQADGWAGGPSSRRQVQACWLASMLAGRRAIFKDVDGRVVCQWAGPAAGWLAGGQTDKRAFYMLAGRQQEERNAMAHSSIGPNAGTGFPGAVAKLGSGLPRA
jgi:hypothetical protein